MRHRGSFELFDYWNRQRGNRAAPTRNSIEPADIRRILPDLFIIQKTPEGEILFRLAGTQLCTLFGQELRGLEFSAIWDTYSFNHVNLLTGDVLSTVKPAFLEASALRSDQSTTEIEVVILPLASENHKIDRALGCIFNLDQTHTMWNNPIGKLKLDSVRLDWEKQSFPVGGGHFDHQERDGADQTNQRPFGMFFQKVMHLRVFEGGRSN